MKNLEPLIELIVKTVDLEVAEKSHEYLIRPEISPDLFQLAERRKALDQRCQLSFEELDLPCGAEIKGPKAKLERSPIYGDYIRISRNVSFAPRKFYFRMFQTRCLKDPSSSSYVRKRMVSTIPHRRFWQHPMSVNRLS